MNLMAKLLGNHFPFAGILGGSGKYLINEAVSVLTI